MLRPICLGDGEEARWPAGWAQVRSGHGRGPGVWVGWARAGEAGAFDGTSPMTDSQRQALEPWGLTRRSEAADPPRRLHSSGAEASHAAAARGSVTAEDPDAAVPDRATGRSIALRGAGGRMAAMRQQLSPDRDQVLASPRRPVLKRLKDVVGSDGDTVDRPADRVGDRVPDRGGHRP